MWPADGGAGCGAVQGYGGGGSSHSPLLAADVMLLHRVAKEGGSGAGDDSGLLDVHVEVVREPWVGRRGVRQVEVQRLGCGWSMFPYPWGAPVPVWGANSLMGKAQPLPWGSQSDRGGIGIKPTLRETRRV